MQKEIFIIPKPQKIEYTRGTYSINYGKQPRRQLDESMPEEAYILKITESGIETYAASKSGFFYAEKTLEQIIFQSGEILPCMTVSDGPLYPYRSFHLDCARHFISVEELKKNIALAAAFKFNHFHWHFSDDQGYRIESEIFPELALIGGARNGDYFGVCRSDVFERHFYTKAEVREIILFASEHFIEIVPEIDIPGHVTAILASHPELSCTGEKQEVATSEGIFEEIFCAGKENTYVFLEKLLEELCELFPGKYFHIGGDEAPKTRWESCPYCRKKMESENLSDTRELQSYMQNRVSAILKKYGKTAIAYNEAALGGNLDADIVLQLWNDDPNDPAMKSFKMKDENGNFTSPNQGAGSRHIKAGGRVISSNMLNSYCDYPAAYVKMKTIFEADLIPQKCENIPDAANRVVGGEALCWSEHIRTPEELEFMIWPRYSAKADRMWSKNESRNFPEFQKSLKILYPYMESYGVKPSSLKDAIPGPIASARQMLKFIKLLGGNNKGKYKDATSAV